MLKTNVNFCCCCVFFQVGFMFNMSPEKFSEIAEDLDPAKPLNVNK